MGAGIVLLTAVVISGYGIAAVCRGKHEQWFRYAIVATTFMALCGAVELFDGMVGWAIFQFAMAFVHLGLMRTVAKLHAELLTSRMENRAWDAISDAYREILSEGDDDD